jgi:hypothetical protein
MSSNQEFRCTFLGLTGSLLHSFKRYRSTFSEFLKVMPSITIL